MDFKALRQSYFSLEMYLNYSNRFRNMAETILLPCLELTEKDAVVWVARVLKALSFPFN